MGPTQRGSSVIAILICLASLGLVIHASSRSASNPRIDDLTVSVEAILKRLPDVVEVDVKVRVEKPTHRIVQLRDWHFITRDAFGIDAMSFSEMEVTESDIDRLYGEFLLQVDAIQTEQLAILRRLIKDHGLKRIFVEGLSVEELPNYLERVEVLRDMERNQITRLRKQLDEARALKSPDIEQQVMALLDEHGVRLLQIGAAGRLLVTGEIEEVLPLEDSVLHEHADPISGNKIRFDRDKVRAREDAQVKAVLDKGPFGLVILGGSHDLSESVRRHVGCEYIQVTTKRFKEFGD